MQYNKLRYLSNLIRSHGNPNYRHDRVISKNGVPYLKFEHFNIIYFGSTRRYAVIFTGQYKVYIGRAPKKGSTYDRGYVFKTMENLENVVKRWMHSQNKAYRGNFNVRSLIPYTGYP